MIRRLPFVLAVAAFGAALQAWGSEPEVTPIIRFGDSADAVRNSVENAHLSLITGTHVKGGGAAGRVDFAAADRPELAIRPLEEPADWPGERLLAIPFDNPTAEPIDLLVRIDDDRRGADQRSLTGRRGSWFRRGRRAVPAPADQSGPGNGNARKAATRSAAARGARPNA
jgi:hypothetical protein